MKLKTLLLGLCASAAVGALALPSAYAGEARSVFPAAGECQDGHVAHHDWGQLSLQLTCKGGAYVVNGTGDHLAYSRFSQDLWMTDGFAWYGPVFPSNSGERRWSFPATNECQDGHTAHHEWGALSLQLTCKGGIYYVNGTGDHIAYSKFSQDLWVSDGSFWYGAFNF